MTIDTRLNELANLFIEKNEEYGNQYKRFGHLMMILLGPIEIRTVSDYNKFMTFFNMATKLDRYANHLKDGGHHKDSLDDLCIYAQIMQELNE